jgi:hypothetical protein
MHAEGWQTSHFARRQPRQERVPLVAELLTAKGYMAEAVRVERAVEQDAGGVDVLSEIEATPTLTLRIHNCAVREIAEHRERRHQVWVLVVHEHVQRVLERRVSELSHLS